MTWVPRNKHHPKTLPHSAAPTPQTPVHLDALLPRSLGDIAPVQGVVAWDRKPAVPHSRSSQKSANLSLVNSLEKIASDHKAIPAVDWRLPPTVPALPAPSPSDISLRVPPHLTDEAPEDSPAGYRSESDLPRWPRTGNAASRSRKPAGSGPLSLRHLAVTHSIPEQESVGPAQDATTAAPAPNELASTLAQLPPPVERPRPKTGHVVGGTRGGFFSSWVFPKRSAGAPQPPPVAAPSPAPAPGKQADTDPQVRKNPPRTTSDPPLLIPPRSPKRRVPPASTMHDSLTGHAFMSPVPTLAVHGSQSPGPATVRGGGRDVPFGGRGKDDPCVWDSDTEVYTRKQERRGKRFSRGLFFSKESIIEQSIIEESPRRKAGSASPGGILASPSAVSGSTGSTTPGREHARRTGMRLNDTRRTMSVGVLEQPRGIMLEEDHLALWAMVAGDATPALAHLGKAQSTGPVTAVQEASKGAGEVSPLHSEGSRDSQELISTVSSDSSNSASTKTSLVKAEDSSLPLPPSRRSAGLVSNPPDAITRGVQACHKAKASMGPVSKPGVPVQGSEPENDCLVVRFGMFSDMDCVSVLALDGRMRKVAAMRDDLEAVVREFNSKASGGHNEQSHGRAAGADVAPIPLARLAGVSSEGKDLGGEDPDTGSPCSSDSAVGEDALAASESMLARLERNQWEVLSSGSEGDSPPPEVLSKGGISPPSTNTPEKPNSSKGWPDSSVDNAAPGQLAWGVLAGRQQEGLLAGEERQGSQRKGPTSQLMLELMARESVQGQQGKGNREGFKVGRVLVVPCREEDTVSATYGGRVICRLAPGKEWCSVPTEDEEFDEHIDHVVGLVSEFYHCCY